MALRGSTGKLVWAFQTVHHDLWDYDNASPPALVTISRNGVDVPAVVQATKTGMLFVLERETGRPVFPVEERAVPASEIPGEEAARTQPFTAATPPLSPHRFAADDVWGSTEAAIVRHAARQSNPCATRESSRRRARGTLVMPSNIGGAHWGGIAIDPVRQLAIVPVNRIAAMVQLIARDGFDLQRVKAQEQRMGSDYEYNMMLGTPYVMRRRMLIAPSGLPCYAAALRHARRHRSEERAGRGKCRSGSANALFSPDVAKQAQDVGLPQPRRPDHGWRRRLHRRRTRPPPPRLRHHRWP